MLTMKWLLKDYMNKQHIETFTELSRRSGIEYQTLKNHMRDIGQFRVFELELLDSVLHFKDEDMLKIVRRQV